jgi:hypothetical protein
VQSDIVIALSGNAHALNLGNGAYVGCRAMIINAAGHSADILAGVNVFTFEAGELLPLIYMPTGWTKTNHLPPGLVLYSADNAYALAQERLLPLNGAVIPVADYPCLVRRTYVGDSLNATAASFFKASNSQGTVRNVAGEYFVLPNAQGVFLRSTGSQTRTITWTDLQGGQHTVNTLYDGGAIGRFQGDRSRRLTGNLGNLYVSAISTTSGGGSLRNDNTSLFWNANTGRWSTTAEAIQFDNNVKPVLDSMNQVPTGADNAPASISLQAVISY